MAIRARSAAVRTYTSASSRRPISDLRVDVASGPISIMTLAAHSRMLDPVLDEFRRFLDGIPLHAPEIPFISNRTGTWITEAQATDPG